MTSRGQCPRGVVLVNVFTPPPHSGNPVSAPVFHPSKFRPPTHLDGWLRACCYCVYHQDDRILTVIVTHRRSYPYCYCYTQTIVSLLLLLHTDDRILTVIVTHRRSYPYCYCYTQTIVSLLLLLHTDDRILTVIVTHRRSYPYCYCVYHQGKIRLSQTMYETATR